jgi:hypothetical protein
VSGLVVENNVLNTRVLGNVTFGIKFHGNSVSVKSAGTCRVFLGNFGEEYIFSAFTPDLGIKNVILGTKRIAWEGEISLECPASKLKSKIIYKEEGWSCINVVNGGITCSVTEKNLYNFGGVIGGEINITSTDGTSELLFNSANLKKSTLLYPPEEIRDNRCSLSVWNEVNKAVIENDMPKADSAKILIEESQRKRRNEGRSYNLRFFEFDQIQEYWVPIWTSKNEVSEEKQKELKNLLAQSFFPPFGDKQKNKIENQPV